MSPTRIELDILPDVMHEAEAAVRKHGEQTHLPDTLKGFTYLAGWDGDDYRDLCQSRFADGHGSWADILLEEVAEAIDEAVKGNATALRDELIQVAATAAHWAAVIDER